MDYSNLSINQAATETFPMARDSELQWDFQVIPANGFMANNIQAFSNDTAVARVQRITDAGGGVVNVRLSVFGNTANDGEARISLTGGVEEEPYLLTVNLTESLAQGKISRSSYSQRFGVNDLAAGSVTISGVTVMPTEGLMAYASNTTFSITGGSASNYTYADGNVTFDLSVSIPTTAAGFPDGILGDLSRDVVIDGTLATGSLAGLPATEALWGNSLITVDFSAQTIQVGWEANGTAYISSVTSGGGTLTPQGDQGTATGGTVSIALPAVTSNTSHNYSIFASNDFDNVMDTLPGGSLVIRRRQQVQSNDITTINTSTTAPPQGTQDNILTFITS